MKKYYDDPKMELMYFHTADVIATSGEIEVDENITDLDDLDDEI